ncbi:putative phosphoglycerate mutase (2,3-diphosphoglycerate-dependent) [Helianthus annuus]|nr:putative phosphoglycerate mutase (2,3-diphosphoglycerate-dependent) [Helianthus annuus]KAJ0588171.1 putative phosphoglycerate mutase (2,3-diphosphoglycerate-dependent) [Helianthus annuus]KAJ0596523.1 putative phosphoglycerate mutase (2,3-diphosphoglycerate-dependent) [Helianthus annuus]KAJ0757183.1 putative phosphoglycerate mutase (2,3-diphosphoglycerate-dependent) [Helianthus annuus]KAJ0760908.1 putative phosphoglycerate mutase (2,3-diphosphoglycerate-dependent) [Helianthus annuus]
MQVCNPKSLHLYTTYQPALIQVGSLPDFPVTFFFFFFHILLSTNTNASFNDPPFILHLTHKHRQNLHLCIDCIAKSSNYFTSSVIMAAMASHQSIATRQSHGYIGKSALHQDCGNISMKLFRGGSFEPLKREGYCCSKRSCGSIQASSSSYQNSANNPILAQSSSTIKDPSKKSSEAALILIRHGESLWNEKNLFTGCVDVPLTKKGVEEAIEAGKRISNIPIDMIYTSALIRAQMTAMLAMTQHRRKKVPIVMHDENEQAKAWSQIFSEETKKQCIPVVTAWQLNERMYGELQGLNKQETADKYGKEQVHEWRRSYDIPPPNGESLEMCAERAVAYFKDQIEPQLQQGKNVMIAAHGNSLRSIIMYLDELTSQEVISLELSTGIPMLYIVKEDKYIRRGSPAAPTEAGVYAYTKNLAKYRQKLDEMLH